MDFLCAPDETFLDELRFVAGRAVGFDIALNMALCWRCISVVQKPRAAPAQVFAALSQRLIQEFFAISISILVSWFTVPDSINRGQ
ncbi:hypothetical protein [Microvirga sp. BSC39]|uniref:hypothetical protein n=1 Tax=Microvirga sp. BSC39 TaxID=1549810 RepID=UPI0004E8900A|nr:hypothetical protein [Microvirga sp. BSC39]KFG69455.1 hypothetical protein JH26_11755 [Microvirga sp. BSC39]